MMAVVNRICPSVQELTQAATRVNISKCGEAIFKRSRLNNRANVIWQFHCPVQGCIYDSESARFFSQLSYLRQHFKKVHSPKVHCCAQCSKSFAVLSDLKRHNLLCGTVFSCATCGVNYSSREALLTHAKRKLHTLSDDVLRRKREIVDASDGVKKLDERPDHRDMKDQSLVFVVTSVDSHVTGNVATKTKLPRLILPKPTTEFGKPVLNLKIIEGSTEKENETVVDKGVQTDTTKIVVYEKHVKRLCGNCTKHDVGVGKARRRQLVNCKTQTKVTGVRFRSRCKKRKHLLKETSSQTEINFVLRSNADVENTTTQTEFTWDLRERNSSPIIPETAFIAEYPVENANNQMWSCAGSSQTMNSNKCIQTIEDLDVDTRFSMSPAVTASTQTSPRCQKNAYLCNERIIDSSLNKYFGIDLCNLHDFNPIFPASSRYSNSLLLATESSVRLLSSETQTDQQLINCLQLDDADQSDSDIVDMGETLSFDIHTQTPKDLESIPYDQLLTNMETQTSDPFLLSALALCDIETQTAVLRQNDSVGLVDTHTQTNYNIGWRQDAHSADMETQTFIPQLVSALMDSHTQTPGSWSSLLDIFNDY